ncbi:MAG: Gldg family protein [Butyricimonas paravirosa]
MKQIIDLPVSTIDLCVLLSRKVEKTFLRVFNDPLLMPFESEISVALKRLVMDMPWVGFLTGHGERDMDQIGERGYNLFAKNKLFRHSLPNQGFDVTGVTLEQDIPDSINIIVIADMHTALSESEMRHLQNYIAREEIFYCGDRQEARILSWNSLVFIYARTTG